MADAGQSPQGQAEANELVLAITDSIDCCLTEHQREVLVALTLNGVPLDVLSDRLNMTRGALYKTLHDARQKLRVELATRALPSTRSSGDDYGQAHNWKQPQAVARTGRAGVLCDECFDRLDEYVELELQGAPADERIPGLRAHLEGCPACHEDYDSLRELVQGSASDG